MTVSGEEYFDYNNNRAALFMLNGDQISKLIFDYSTEELFYVYRKYNDSRLRFPLCKTLTKVLIIPVIPFGV